VQNNVKASVETGTTNSQLSMWCFSWPAVISHVLQVKRYRSTLASE